MTKKDQKTDNPSAGINDTQAELSHELLEERLHRAVHEDAAPRNRPFHELYGSNDFSMLQDMAPKKNRYTPASAVLMTCWNGIASASRTASPARSRSENLSNRSKAAKIKLSWYRQPSKKNLFTITASLTRKQAVPGVVTVPAKKGMSSVSSLCARVKAKGAVRDRDKVVHMK